MHKANSDESTPQLSLPVLAIGWVGTTGYILSNILSMPETVSPSFYNSPWVIQLFSLRTESVMLVLK